MEGDYLRAAGARFLPRRFYSAISFLWNRLVVLTKEGPAVQRALFAWDDREVTLRLRALRHPFRFRRCASHAEGILQNALRHEYDAFPPLRPPRVIVDAGGFIGDLSAHWATKYPGARVICLEPNAENFRLAELNLQPYAPQVTCLRKGLWSHPARLCISGHEMESSVAEVADGPPDLEGIDIPTLMREQHIEELDILKLDIEGAEKEVLGPGAEPWLARVGLLIVEFHDPAVENDSTIKLRSLGFTLRRHRSLHFFRRAAHGGSRALSPSKN